LQIAPIKQNNLLCGRTQKVSCFKAQAKRGARDFCHEEVALFQPFHISPEYFLGRDSPVDLPGILLNKMMCEHLMPHSTKHFHDFSGYAQGRAVS
jgi:hypothetical protein